MFSKNIKKVLVSLMISIPLGMSAATYSHDTTLSAGWNKFSIPAGEVEFFQGTASGSIFVGGTYTGESIIPADSLEIIWAWKDGAWKSMTPTIPVAEINKFETGIPYYVKLKDTASDVTFNVTGDISTTKVVTLGEGWNKISSYDNEVEFFQGTASGSIFVGGTYTGESIIPADSLEIIWAWKDGAWKSMTPTVPVAEINKFEPGLVYFIKIKDGISPFYLNLSGGTIENPPEPPSLDDNTTTELSAPPSVPSI